MLYTIIGEDVENSLEKRLAVRAAHLERIRNLQHNGHLIIAGPLPAIDSEEPGDAGFTGSLIIAEFDSLQSAQDWANNDPYYTHGVYKKITIKPFKKVLP